MTNHPYSNAKGLSPTAFKFTGTFLNYPSWRRRYLRSHHSIILFHMWFGLWVTECTPGHIGLVCINSMRFPKPNLIIPIYLCDSGWQILGSAFYFDGLVQEKRNSIANALELRLSCTNLSISCWCQNVETLLTYLAHREGNPPINSGFSLTKG